MLKLLLCLLLLLLAPAALAGRGALLNGPFSLNAEPLQGLPFAIHWHPRANQATFVLSYPEGGGSNETAEFAHIWSFDEDEIFVYYSGFNRTFCHRYRAEGTIPRRFWRGDRVLRRGSCDGRRVTWYEGAWNELFVPYGMKRVALGFDETVATPICAELETFGHHSSLPAHHKGKCMRFPVDFDSAPAALPPDMPMPSSLTRQTRCRNRTSCSPRM